MFRKIKQIAVAAVCVAIFVAAGAGRVSAHHGWSEYGIKAPTVVKTSAVLSLARTGVIVCSRLIAYL